jgi:site-specific DNA-cytosine methylase
MKYVVLSLFDGIGCGRVILDQLNLEVERYFSSEINPAPMRVTSQNFSEVEHVGDVRNLKVMDYIDVNLILMGSPCQGFSIAGKRKGMTTSENLTVSSLDQYMELKNEGVEFDGQSYLFWEAVRLVQGITDMRHILGLSEPLWIMENVIMDHKWKNMISNTLGIDPYQINASLLTAQNRDRYYWTNIPDVTIPEDHGVLLWDIVPDAYSGAGVRGVMNKKTGKYEGKLSIRQDGKSNCLTLTSGGISKKTGKPYGCSLYQNLDGEIKPLTIEQMEQIQGLPIGYTDVPGVSQTERIRMIGNGWSIETVKHIIQNLIPDLQCDPAGGHGLESHI